VKYNPFHLLDWNAGILPLLNENFGRLKRLLEKGHVPDHEKGGSDEINVTGLNGVLADKQLSDWQVLAEVEVSSDCDYVDFTGLDINRDWFYTLFFTLHNPTASTSSYSIFIEGDYTETNYTRQRLEADGTNIDASSTNDSRFEGVQTGKQDSGFLLISKDPSGYFRWSAFNNREQAGRLFLILRIGMKLATVTNINQIRISASTSGAIGAGSRFILARPRS